MAGEVNRNELRDIRLCYFRERRNSILGARGCQTNQVTCVGGYRSIREGFAHQSLRLNSLVSSGRWIFDDLRRSAFATSLRTESRFEPFHH